MAGVIETCCISVLLCPVDSAFRDFYSKAKVVLTHPAPPAEIVCPGVSAFSSHPQTPWTMDLGLTHVGLGVSALLCTVTSLSPFPRPGQWGYPKCLTGWVAEGVNAECLAPAWLSQAGYAPSSPQCPHVEVALAYYPHVVCSQSRSRP